MPDAINKIRDDYIALVDQYLHGGDEKHLGKIEKLGKAMTKADMPIERVAKFHHAAVKFLTRQRAMDQRVACASVLPLTHLIKSYAAEYRAKKKRKTTESKLEVAKFAVANIKEGIVITDAHGTIIDVTPAFCHVTGYSREEAIGKNPRMLKSRRQNKHFYQKMWATIQEKYHWEGRMWNQRKNGEDYPEYITIDAICDEDGNIQNIVGAFSDIGEQVALEAQLHQAQKMEAVGTLVSGIAHNFNNAICGIQGNVYLAKRGKDSPDQLQRRLQTIDDLCQHSADIVSQLLTFSRKTEKYERTELAVVPLVKETAKLARIGIPENIWFDLDCADLDLIVHADLSLFQQMLFNLINNARDAVANVDNPCIHIKVDSIHKDQALVDRSIDARMIDYCHISIADNGHGIDNNHLKRIFDPFFTTKDVGKGTGLGLSSVYGTVKSHKGVIEVESTIGKGTCFHVYLPIPKHKRHQLPNLAKNTPPTIKQKGGETLLLVDDNPAVCKIMCEVCKVLGYRCLCASNAQQALALFDAHKDEINLAILDVVLPDNDGGKLHTTLLKHNPALPLIFISGYSLDQRNPSHTIPKGYPLLSKPINIDLMSTTIRQMLARNRTTELKIVNLV